MFKPLFCLALMIMLCLAAPARAEETWDGIKITCLADLDYFSIEPIGIPLTHEMQNVMDNEAKASEATERLKSTSGIYTAKSMLDHPYTCKLSSRSISVEIVDYASPHYPGECGLLEHFDVAIRTNGTDLDRFSAYGINRCTGPEQHLVELNHFRLQDCTLPTGSKQQAVCTSSTLK